MIVEIENFLNEEQIKDLYLYMESGALVGREGKLSAGEHIQDKKKSTVYDDNPKTRIIHKTIFPPDKADLVASKVTCGEFENVVSSVAEYDKGDFYDWHLDRLTTGEGKTVKIAYTIWLNDSIEYEGGALRVKHEFGERTFHSVNAGTAVFYPTGYFHKVEEVTKGKRVVVIGLIDCMISSLQDRFAIIQMNESIQKLRDLSEIQKNIMSETSFELDAICDDLAFVEKRFQKKCIEG